MTIRRLAVAIAALVLSATTASAKEIIIKLGTLAPSGSSWHELLKEMGQKWSEASGGQVKLRIFPGGTLGNEGDMVRKMRIGQLQAAALTVVGLHDITPEPQALSAPLLVTSYDEMQYVLSKMEPQLDKALADKGYVAVSWDAVGFVRFFSTKPLRSPSQAHEHKIFTWEGDPASADAWRAAGFEPVVLSSTDVIPSLQTGMIDTVATAPLYAFTSRMYQKANHMLDLRWSLLLGATIVKKDTWDEIPADVQRKLIDIAHQYEGRIEAEVRRMDEDAVVEMRKQGLDVIVPSASDVAAWQAAGEKGNAVVRGRIVPAGVFDEVKRLAAEYRSAHH